MSAIHEALKRKKEGKKHKHMFVKGECKHCGVKIKDEKEIESDEGEGEELKKEEREVRKFRE